jgi:tol-pal system protein YbgF
VAGAVALAAPTMGCYAPQLLRLQGGLDSLRTTVDTLTVRDQVAWQTLADTRRELASQRDLLLATRATSTSTAREVSESLARIDGKLEDVMAKLRITSERSSGREPAPVAPPATPGGAAPPAAAGPGATDLYDQATQDLTMGRYGMALQGYRDLLVRFPNSDLADNAQYGVGECYFAQAAFDSAAVEYARVDAQWPRSDRVPASMYKLALAQERLGRAAESRRTLEELVRRFPTANEAQLARDRIGVGRR